MQKYGFSALLVIVSLMISVILSELILRFFLLDTKEYENEAISFVMKYLKADEDVGYLWKSNLHVPDTPGWYDQEKFPLITDENGFFNPESAIRRKRSNVPVDIVGIGDSFMHGAAYEFYEYFNRNGLLYYNFSMSRHSPPQYNLILEKYALPLKPKWVVYGIYENDFDEVIDFENWRQTHSDWFAYHSGTWFGAAVHVPPWRALLETYAPGISMLEKRVRRQFNLGAPAYQRVQQLPVTEQEKSEKVFRYIEEAYRRTVESGASFLCLIIPARDVDAQGRTGRSYHYDYVVDKLKSRSVPTLDLRPVFNNSADRRNLYYKLDAHWNRIGMKMTEELIFKQYIRPFEINGDRVYSTKK